jgi:hypothetical protein
MFIVGFQHEFPVVLMKVNISTTGNSC